MPKILEHFIQSLVIICKITYARLSFPAKRLYDMPLGVLYGNRLVVAADSILKGTVVGSFLFFPADGNSPQLLHRVSDKQAKEIEQLPNVRRVSTRLQRQPPEKETGRYNKR
jgi:hypothetical protein